VSATTAGIASTVAATRAADDATLRALLAGRIAELRAQGTTTVEIKSGYGLTVADEARAAPGRRGDAETTFLGAHVVPRRVLRNPAHRRAGRVTQHPRRRGSRRVSRPGHRPDARRLCAARPLDRRLCEPASPHAFDGDEARAVLEAGRAAGLGLRVHGNQLGPGPGVALAGELGAASVDHCTYLTDTDVDALAGGDTVATLLPGVEFSTRPPYPDARRLLDAGVPLALATDCNPGTCASSSMPLMIALAVREMGLTPDEALHAATAGAARALRRADVGVVAPGRRADLTVLDAPSHLHLAYRPGVPLARALDLGAT
jgi:imidazolonepropionase